MERSAQGNNFILLNSANPFELYKVTQHTWYKKLRRSMKSVSIRDFILHLIVKGKELFFNTQRRYTWIIWHDRLSILWDKTMQE